MITRNYNTDKNNKLFNIRIVDTQKKIRYT